MDYDALLAMAGEIGYRLLQNGAEIYRVEESVGRILAAYGATGGDVFAIPNCLIVSCDTDRGKAVTRLRRVVSHGIDLSRVERYNGLCRRVCGETPEFSRIWEEIHRIEQTKKYPFYLEILGFFVGSFAFTRIYGGGAMDGLCAGLCSVAIRLSVRPMERLEANLFFKYLAASAIGAAVALLTVALGVGVNADKIIIGALMSLVPGIVITNFMRDVMAGDWVAGQTKLAEALLVATAIALGAGLSMAGARLLGGM